MIGIPADAGTADSADTPGHDLERHAGVGQRERLLAAAAEDERVAALEAHDLEALRGPARRAASFSSAWRIVSRGISERIVGRLGDELRRDEHVVDERVARCGRGRGPSP